MHRIYGMDMSFRSIANFRSLELQISHIAIYVEYILYILCISIYLMTHSNGHESCSHEKQRRKKFAKSLRILLQLWWDFNPNSANSNFNCIIYIIHIYFYYYILIAHIYWGHQQFCCIHCVVGFTHIHSAPIYNNKIIQYIYELFNSHTHLNFARVYSFKSMNHYSRML